MQTVPTVLNRTVGYNPLSTLYARGSLWTDEVPKGGTDGSELTERNDHEEV